MQLSLFLHCDTSYSVDFATQSTACKVILATLCAWCFVFYSVSLLHRGLFYIVVRLDASCHSSCSVDVATQSTLYKEILNTLW